MNDQNELLVSIVIKLTRAGIPYMITGSFGANFHGEPRATNDIDIVIHPTLQQVQEFTKSLDAYYYVSLEAARTAVEKESMFNVIDTRSGWKVDLIVRKSRPFSIEEFQRRQPIAFQGLDLYVLSVEDAILSKLEWAKKGDSERQRKDAESIAVMQWENLDRKYLQQWAEDLSIEEELARILREAEGIQKET